MFAEKNLENRKSCFFEIKSEIFLFRKFFREKKMRKNSKFENPVGDSMQTSMETICAKYEAQRSNTQLSKSFRVKSSDFGSSLRFYIGFLYKMNQNRMISRGSPGTTWGAGYYSVGLHIWYRWSPWMFSWNHLPDFRFSNFFSFFSREKNFETEKFRIFPEKSTFSIFEIFFGKNFLEKNFEFFLFFYFSKISS